MTSDPHVVRKCQSTSGRIWKTKSMKAVKSCVCISCGMIPTWQKTLNIIVQWTMKRNAVSGCNAPSSLISFFFLTSALLLPSKHLSTLAAKAPTDLKCWCYMLLFYSFYSLEDVQFQFRWNICVSGGTKMRPIKACQGTEGRVKWCANALLSLQWHYKWLPVGMLITQDRKRGRVESLGCCMNCGRRNGR